MNEKKMTVNPMWVLFLGACPALGATGTLQGAAAMGVTVLAVMLLTALVMALLRRILPERAIIAATILTAALFTSAAQLVLHAVLPSVYKMLGVYLAVAAVNLLVFSRSAGSASGLCVGKVVVTGLEFLAVIAVVALLRELFGLGTVWGQEIAFLKAHAVASLQKPMGGFLVSERCRGVLGPGTHASTFGGNPVCAAAALEVQEILDDAALEQVAEKGQ